MTRSQLEAVVDALVEIVDSWNDAAQDDDRGRNNDRIVLTLADDGSGYLGCRRFDFEGDEIEDLHEFRTLDGLLRVLVKGEGIELEQESPHA